MHVHVFVPVGILSWKKMSWKKSSWRSDAVIKFIEFVRAYACMHQAILDSCQHFETEINFSFQYQNLSIMKNFTFDFNGSLHCSVYLVSSVRYLENFGLKYQKLSSLMG